MNYFHIHKHKKLFPFLKSYYGISSSTAAYLINRWGYPHNLIISQLSSETFNELTQFVNKHYSPRTLYKQKKDAINLLKLNKSYRGVRLKKGLPNRGQKTKTNAKTSRKFKV